MLTKYNLIIFLFLTSSLDAQIIKFPPLRNLKASIVNDARSHDPNPFTGDPDLCTVTHECVHGASNYLSNKEGNGYYCYYVLDNIGFKVKGIKKFKLKDLADKIPKQYHGSSLYKLYLIDQQRYFQNQPEYIMDEWNAYTCGTMCAVEIKDNYRSQDSGYRMLEMAIYSQYFKKMANQKDIDEFVDLEVKRNLLICSKINITDKKMIDNLEILKKTIKELK